MVWKKAIKTIMILIKLDQDVNKSDVSLAIKI